MSNKKQNAEIAKKILSAPFWRMDYFPRYFHDEFTMEFPSAPPGMPNYFESWEAERCCEWLNRTVKSWESVVEEFYSTPDPDMFWAIGTCGGTVYWGEHEGQYETKFVARVEFKDGKIYFMKGMMEPIRMLKAAGLKVPAFRKGIDDSHVDAYLAAHPEARKNKEAKVFHVAEQEEEIDRSPEAVAQRISNNLQECLCGVKREEYRKLTTAGPGFHGAAWFVPDERPWMDPPDPVMINDNRKPPEDVQVRVHAWLKASSPWMYRDTRGKIYKTDDPYMFFVEMYSHGPACWYGNGCEEGHYHQPYFMIIRMDDAGRMIYRAEVLNPIYKYESVHVSLPSFPYYS